MSMIRKGLAIRCCCLVVPGQYADCHREPMSAHQHAINLTYGLVVVQRGVYIVLAFEGLQQLVARVRRITARTCLAFNLVNGPVGHDQSSEGQPQKSKTFVIPQAHDVQLCFSGCAVTVTYIGRAAHTDPVLPLHSSSVCRRR